MTLQHESVSRHWVTVVSLMMLPLTALALWMYRPWEPTPFPVLDFETLLEVFAREDTFGQRLAALVRVYASEGRVVTLSMALLTSQWSLFGADTVGWQWSRFVMMLLVTLCALLLLSRFGASRSGAMAGAALYVVAGAATQSWTTPQAAEPLGALFTFVAVAAALSYRRSDRRMVHAMIVGIALAAAIQVKEPFVAVVPFVLLVAAMQTSDGRFRRPLFDRELVLLVAIAGVIMLIAAIIPVLVIRHSTAPGAYGAAYSMSGLGIERLSQVIRATVLPITRVVLFPANLLVLAIIGSGALMAMRAGADKSRLVLRATPLAGLLLGAGVLTYLPWPAYPGYYALPFLFGVSLLLATGISAWEQVRSRLAYIAVLSAAILAIAWGALLGRNGREEDRARRLSARAAAESIMQRTFPEQLIVAVEDPATSGALGDSFRRWAASHGDTLPPAVDVSCDTARSMVERGAAMRGAVLQLAGRCGDEAIVSSPPRAIWTISYTRRDWRTLRVVRVAASTRVW